MKDLYLQQFVRHSVELLRLGYDDARGGISATTQEEHVTELIVQAINKRCEVGNLPSYLQRYEASDDAKVNHPKRHGKRRKRIDIRLVRVAKGRPTFEIEAKCLRTSTNTISDYTGPAGLTLFVNEEYAMGKPVGGMLGYIQNCDSLYWRNELQRKLMSNAAALGYVAGLEEVNDFAFESSFTSRHLRNSGGEIVITHVLADCT